MFLVGAFFAMGGAETAQAIGPDSATFGWHEIYPAVDFGLPWDLYTTRSGIYVLCEGFVVHSADSGATWNRFDFPGCGSARAGAFSGDSIAILVGDNGMIYKSIDAGHTWKQKQSPFSGMNLRAVAFATPSIVFASGGSGLVLKSTDGGETWTSPGYIDLFQFNPRGTYAFVKPVTDKILWLVRDSRILNVIPSGAVPQGKLEVLRSSDGGNSWDMMGGPWIYENEPDDDRLQTDFATDGSSIKVCDANSMSLVVKIAKTTWKTFRTTNTGATWDSVPLPSTPQLRFPHMFDCSTGWSTDFAGTQLYRSAASDNGKWVSKLIPESGGSLYLYDFRDTLTGYGLVESQSASTLYSTTDGGTSWRSVFVSPLNSSGTMTAVSFISPTRGWVMAKDASGPMVMATTTGGTQWSVVSSDARLQNIRGIQFANANTGWVFGDTLYSTTNGGVSWSPSTELPLDPARPSIHYVRVQFVNSQVGWAVRSDFLTYRTTDAGNNWVNCHDRDTAVNITIVSAVNSEVLFAMGTASDIPYEFRLTDAGKSTGLSELAPDGNTPTQPVQLCFADSLNGWFADTSANVYRTWDGGMSWTFLSQAVDNKPPMGLAFGDTSVGWLLKGAYVINGSLVSAPAINRLEQSGASTIRDQCLFRQLNAMTFLADTLGWAVGDNYTVYRYFLPKSARPHHAPIMVLNVPLIDFGYSKPGHQLVDTVIVSNVGDDTLFINHVDITGDQYNGFQIATFMAQPISIVPGSSFPFLVGFDPQLTFKFSGSLNLYTNSDTQHVLLKGTGGLIGIDEHGIVTLEGFTLQGYPNPFRESVTVGMQSATRLPSDATVKVYDALGRTVADLTTQFRSGATSVTVNGSGLPSGRYVVRLQTSAGQALQPLLLMR